MLLASTSASFAEEVESFGYGLEGNNLVFTTSEQAREGGSFRLAIKDGQRAKISVELVDIISNAAGSKTTIPLDSSPFTPKGLVQLTRSFPDYEPSEEIQYFDISMKFKDDAVLDRPVLGGIEISLIPEKKAEGQFVAESAIVATFAYLPATGLNLEEYSPALSLMGPIIERRSPDYFPLNLFPELPFVLNHGDVSLSYQLKNTGKVFLDTTTEQSVQQVGLFGQQDKLILEDLKKIFLVPEQFSEAITDISPEGSESPLLGIGLYRFTVSATGEMGDQFEASASNEQLLIIFPWKQSILLVGLLLVFRKRIRRAFKSLVDLGKAFRDFRDSTDPRPNLAPRPDLVLRSEQRPQPTTKTFGIKTWPFVKKQKEQSRSERTTPSRSFSGALSFSPAAPSRPITPAAPEAKAPYSASRPSSSEARPLYPQWYQPPKKSN